MSEIKEYKLDLSEIEKTFGFKKGITHNTGSKYKLLPYTIKDENAVYEFEGVVGSFSRIISNKELIGNFNSENFINDITEYIAEYEGKDSELVFKDIIRSMFIDGDNLVNFHIKTMNYMESTKSDDKIADFLHSVLFDTDLKERVLKCYDKEVDNMVYKLVLKALPKLKDKEYSTNVYRCYIPFVRTLFMNDFKFLINNQELYKTSLRRFLEYYYMFYVSQLAIKLNKFEKANLDEVEKIYYTLNWEKTSKSRTSYRLGLNLLQTNITSLFSHAVVLEMLNHHGLEERLGYLDLAEVYNLMDKQEIEDQISLVANAYKNQITDIDWHNFIGKDRDIKVNGFASVYKLFDMVEYQFIKSSTRNDPYKGYSKWFEKFVYKNFTKQRGPLGRSLNITEEDIILMTKICIKDNKKIKVNKLFNEFEMRGLFFDRDSKTKIVQLYEKLNLLEKKSDSGDAQYVKSVL